MSESEHARYAQGKAAAALREAGEPVEIPDNSPDPKRDLYGGVRDLESVIDLLHVKVENMVDAMADGREDMLRVLADELAEGYKLTRQAWSMSHDVAVELGRRDDLNGRVPITRDVRYSVTVTSFHVREGRHYYADATVVDSKTVLTPMARRMTKREAKELNEVDGTIAGRGIHREGELTRRFFTAQAAAATGARYLMSMFGADLVDIDVVSADDVTGWTDLAMGRGA